MHRDGAVDEKEPPTNGTLRSGEDDVPVRLGSRRVRSVGSAVIFQRGIHAEGVVAWYRPGSPEPRAGWRGGSAGRREARGSSGGRGCSCRRGGGGAGRGGYQAAGGGLRGGTGSGWRAAGVLGHWRWADAEHSSLRRRLYTGPTAAPFPRRTPSTAPSTAARGRGPAHKSTRVISTPKGLVIQGAMCITAGSITVATAFVGGSISAPRPLFAPLRDSRKPV